ncbi:MAG: CapA family protein [Anaerolineales bacterium]|nr:CapA family protein [Anaerolineales bacterium]
MSARAAGRQLIRFPGPGRWRLGLAALSLALSACAPLAGSPPPAGAAAQPASPVPPATVAGPPTATASPPAPTAAPPSPPPATSTPVLLPSPTAEPEITLLFTGDINPARCVYEYMRAANDMALPYRALAETLQAADLTIGSLDASISDYNPPSPCNELHRNLLAPAAVVEGLQFAGFDLMAAATNHVRDCGLVRGCDFESLLDTRANLLAAGIQPVGIGRDLAEAAAPVLVTVRGVRFAFLAFTAVNGEVWAGPDRPGAAPFLKDVYLEAVRQARAQADVVVVQPHWGREFTGQLSWEQTGGAQALVEAGADLVVGNNPHHVQAVEAFPNGAVVAYALGNFVFDQQWSDGTRYTVQGLLLRARFRGAALQDVDLIPIVIVNNFQPQLAPPDQAAEILQAVADSLGTRPGSGN